MIDLNNRLLGDGSLSDDLSPALAICEQSGRDGVEEIVVTLRMAGSARNDAERARNFERALSELREQLQKKSRIDLKLGCGYEWLLSEDLPGRLDEFDRRPAINESNYLLLSFPSLVVPAGCERLIDEVISEGYVPIITHPECSRPVRRNRSIIGNLIKSGCLIQADALSITGGYTKEIELFSRELLERGQVHFIATRASHRLRREASLSAAMDRASKIIGRGAAQCLVRENPSSVLVNAPMIETGGQKRPARPLEAVLNHQV